MPRPDLENRAILRNLTNEELLQYVNRESDAIHEIADRFESLMDDLEVMTKTAMINKSAGDDTQRKLQTIKKVLNDVSA